MFNRHTNNLPHPYHLVDPSPWPVVGAAGAFILVLGAVLFMDPDTLGEGLAGAFEPLGLWLVAPGMLLVIYTMYAWWKDVVREATFEGRHTPVVQIGHRYGMALFIASEVMFFVAFLWAFFNASLFPTEAVGFLWPPASVETIDPLDLPLFKTLVLVTSSFTVIWARHDIMEAKKDHATLMLGITVLLGALFISVQAFEYGQTGFGFTEGIYPTTFFMATGFLGFHVIIGTCFLCVCWLRLVKGHFTPDHHFGFEAAAWYWHFVGVIWLFLYTCIYWWGST